MHNIYCIAINIMHLWISAVSALAIGLLLRSIIFIAHYNQSHPQPAESQVCYFE